MNMVRVMPAVIKCVMHDENLSYVPVILVLYNGIFRLLLYVCTTLMALL